MVKKTIGLMLTLALAACLLAGCGDQAAQTANTTPNDIVTYTKIDPTRTQLYVSRLGNNANAEALSRAFEKENPDVQVICLDLTSGTSAYHPVIDWVTHGVAPDVMFVIPETITDNALVVKYFEDLSTNPVIKKFENAALDRVAVNGFVYFLPAPSEINCMIYNETLFEQYGWRVPTTFDEFVALCVQIREDTGGAVQPWNPNAKYDNVLSTALQAFVYEELFGGADNRAWYNAFCAGEATFAGHMEPFYQMIQTLVDNGIMTEEYFNYSATARGKEFQAGEIAMYNAPVSRMASTTYKFSYMPYPTTKGDIGYVNDYFSAMLGVTKRERTEKEKSALNRYLDFYGSAEGQNALIGDTLMVSNVKGVPFTQAELLAGIKQVIERGNMFCRLDFPGSSEVNWSNREKAESIVSVQPGLKSWTFRAGALSMVKGEKTGAEIIAEIDAKPYTAADDKGGAVKIADITEDFTVFEFSCYIADMYRETAGADIGLINHGIAYRGNLVRLFAGDVFDSYMNPIKPRSFANNSTLVKLSMTGRQIIDALNHPVGYDCISNSVYAFSGLKCEIRPWNALGEKYTGVKLADGSPLDMEKLYTVAVWEGTIGAEYITETLAAFPGTWEELMQAKLTADKSVAPARDGRVTLVWE